jgi:hypothetical protein
MLRRRPRRLGALIAALIRLQLLDSHPRLPGWAQVGEKLVVCRRSDWWGVLGEFDDAVWCLNHGNRQMAVPTLGDAFRGPCLTEGCRNTVSITNFDPADFPKIKLYCDSCKAVVDSGG